METSFENIYFKRILYKKQPQISGWGQVWNCFCKRNRKKIGRVAWAPWRYCYVPSVRQGCHPAYDSGDLRNIITFMDSLNNR